jgi:hypothetical protein
LDDLGYIVSARLRSDDLGYIVSATHNEPKPENVHAVIDAQVLRSGKTFKPFPESADG